MVLVVGGAVVVVVDGMDGGSVVLVVEAAIGGPVVVVAAAVQEETVSRTIMRQVRRTVDEDTGVRCVPGVRGV